MTVQAASYVSVATLSEVQATGCKVIHIEGHTIALFAQQGNRVLAVDNRCPHMGFPLNKGTVRDGILTCHWHHARFDLASGGTFDQWADDVRAFPVEIRNGEVYLDLGESRDILEHQRERLQVGLERNLPLVIGKAVLVLSDPVEPFRIGLEFGTRYRDTGWAAGLTIHTCMMNMLPYLHETDRPRALYNGLIAVANDTSNVPPRFPIRPLPNSSGDIQALRRWFREFIEVRDAEGAERCIISAIQAGATPRQVADMLFAAVTDHRYIRTGHPADFTNKALEALDMAGWDYAEVVLPSLVHDYATADRMEEDNAWRNPTDLVAILESTFEQLPTQPISTDQPWQGGPTLVDILLGQNPYDIADTMLDALRSGCGWVELSEWVSYAAARRIAHFHTSNEFGDWDTALHTFTFANAIEQGLRRAPSVELLRGVFDAAMSLYLDRFLNIPATPLPQPKGMVDDPLSLLDALTDLLDRQQQVNPAGALVAQYLSSGGAPEPLLATLGGLLLREDRNFHTIQMIESAFKQYHRLRDTEMGTHVLVAAARYLAAHAPTARAQGQTFQIAQRLHRGEHIFAE
ncbi:MAG: Rieske 2Fe-2S domain-containing protein [Anaerolineales bacterium]|nr:Rieske 2Fe-2S domain-containing protein [Anaerolineales bacterium]